MIKRVNIDAYHSLFQSWRRLLCKPEVLPRRGLIVYRKMDTIAVDRYTSDIGIIQNLARPYTYIPTWVKIPEEFQTEL